MTEAEAQAVVQSWFGALAAGDYQKMETLTSGTAAEETRALATAIQAGAAQRGVTAQLVVKRLDLAPGPGDGTGQAALASFEIDVNAVIGPASFTAQQVKGSATFVVERVDGELKITEIRDPVGLPTSGI